MSNFSSYIDLADLRAATNDRVDPAAVDDPEIDDGAEITTQVNENLVGRLLEALRDQDHLTK